MDKFLSNLPENLKFSINETISIFILILTIMLITKISIKKKWITEEQSVISSVVIVFLDALLLYAGPDVMSRFLAAVPVAAKYWIYYFGYYPEDCFKKEDTG